MVDGCEKCADPQRRRRQRFEQSDESPRKQRLDAVRQTFLSEYCNTALLGLKNNQDGGGGGSSGLSGLLDQFAEKVGIRTSKSTVV